MVKKEMSTIFVGVFQLLSLGVARGDRMRQLWFVAERLGFPLTEGALAVEGWPGQSED